MEKVEQRADTLKKKKSRESCLRQQKNDNIGALRRNGTSNSIKRAASPYAEREAYAKALRSGRTQFIQETERKAL